MPKISNLGHYAEIVKQHALARRAIKQFDAMGRRLENANGNVPEVLREVSTLSAFLASSLDRAALQRLLCLVRFPLQNYCAWM